MVKINENIRYDYDGRNHRIAKTVGGVKTLSFFNSDWQELERRCNDVTTTFLWGLRYIDDLIYRDKNDEKLYSLADPNWNVIATTDETGEVQERFVYDAFGKVNGLNSDWNRTFTGQVLDHETSLMLYRNRFYYIDLGRFLLRDPIGYNDGLNIYSYVTNAPVDDIDPKGKKKRGSTPINRKPKKPRGPGGFKKAVNEGIAYVTLAGDARSLCDACRKMSTHPECSECNASECTILYNAIVQAYGATPTLSGPNTCNRWIDIFEKEMIKRIPGHNNPGNCLNYEVVHSDVSMPWPITVITETFRDCSTELAE